MLVGLTELASGFFEGWFFGGEWGQGRVGWRVGWSFPYGSPSVVAGLTRITVASPHPHPTCSPSFVS